MNDNICKGKQIWEEIERDFHQVSCSRNFNQEERLEQLENKEWVSLEWLKKEIFKKHNQKLNSTEDHYYNKALGDIILLFGG